MLIVSPTALRNLMTALVNATHGMTDTAGERVVMSTIDDRALRAAALAGLMMTTGKVVWPGDEQLVIRQPKRQPGAILVEGI